MLYSDSEILDFWTFDEENNGEIFCIFCMLCMLCMLRMLSMLSMLSILAMNTCYELATA